MGATWWRLQGDNTADNSSTDAETSSVASAFFFETSAMRFIPDVTVPSRNVRPAPGPLAGLVVLARLWGDVWIAGCADPPGRSAVAGLAPVARRRRRPDAGGCGDQPAPSGGERACLPGTRRVLAPVQPLASHWHGRRLCRILRNLLLALSGRTEFVAGRTRSGGRGAGRRSGLVAYHGRSGSGPRPIPYRWRAAFPVPPRSDPAVCRQCVPDRSGSIPDPESLTSERIWLHAVGNPGGRHVTVRFGFFGRGY